MTWGDIFSTNIKCFCCLYTPKKKKQHTKSGTENISHVCIYMCVCVVWACLPQQWQHPQCRTVTFWQFKQSAYVRCNHIVHLPLVWHIEVEHSEIHHFILAFIKNQQLVDVLSGCYHLVDDIFAGAQRIDHCHRMT